MASGKNPIPKPWRAMPDADRECTRLFFKDDNIFFPTDRSVDFCMRGAVCWPATVGSGIDTATEGFVLLAGQELSTRRVFVFEQSAFVSIDPIVDPETSRIIYDGITHRMAKWWSRYYCDVYYWHDHMDTHLRYLRQLINSPFLNPTPHFSEVIWHDQSQAEHSLFELVTHARLIHWAGNDYENGRGQPLYHALLSFRDEGEINGSSRKAKVLPATKAAMALAMGFEKYPWRG